MAPVLLPPGIPITVDGDPSPVLDAVATAFACCPPAPTSLPVRTRIAALSLRAESLPDALPPWAASSLDAHAPDDPTVRFSRTPLGSVATSRTAESCSCAWMTPDAARITLAAAKNSNAPSHLCVQSVLTPLLRELFAVLVPKAVLLHCAALARPNDKDGFLLLALGGGGKSTTCIGATLAGARLVCDDLGVLAPHESSCTLHGLPDVLNLTRQTLDFFPELEPLVNPEPTRGLTLKWRLQPTRAFPPHRRARSCTPRAVYAVRISPHGPDISPLPPADALRTLSEAHCFASGQSVTRAAFQTIAAFLDHTPCFLLDTGPDPRQLGAWILQHSQSIR